MRVLVTGADGFVGRYLVARLGKAGHTVTAACRPGVASESPLPSGWKDSVHALPFELSNPDSVRAALTTPQEAVVHLAAIATVREARADPGRAWEVNAAGTARLVDSLIQGRDLHGLDPILLVVSSAEIYGSGPILPRVETDSPRPQSSYAASKLGAEMAALEAWHRTRLRVIVARPFTHTGPGQRPPYVVPSFIERLLAARTTARTQVPTGNLEPIRDLLDVRDVVEAYLRLITHGEAGETYNIARGEGISLRELFHRIAALVGVTADPVPDPELVRREDIPYLVGNAGKLQRATGWSPAITLEQTLREMVHAQAH